MKTTLLRVAALFLTATLFAVIQTGASAEWADPLTSAPTEFDKVEEDWELVIDDPDPLRVGPQVTTCMTPFAVGEAPFVAFNLNYRDRPAFQPGGIQVQVWSPAGQLIDTSSSKTALFNTLHETVTWTQSMKIQAGVVSFDVKNGQSQTWGKFGQGEGLLGVNYPASPTTLMGYDPDASASRSGVTWQSNRVTRLVLKRVRYYAGGSLIWTDENPRTVLNNQAG